MNYREYQEERAALGARMEADDEMIRQYERDADTERRVGNIPGANYFDRMAGNAHDDLMRCGEKIHALDQDYWGTPEQAQSGAEAGRAESAEKSGDASREREAEGQEQLGAGTGGEAGMQPEGAEKGADAETGAGVESSPEKEASNGESVEKGGGAGTDAKSSASAGGDYWSGPSPEADASPLAGTEVSAGGGGEADCGNSTEAKCSV